MDRDEGISTGYCLVCAPYRALKHTSPVRRGGLAPALTEEAGRRLEIGGAYCRLPTAKDSLAYCRAP